MAVAIKVENLSKAYQLGEFSTGTISRDIERWWHKVRGKEDPFLKVGETNDRTTKGSSEVVWSLKDISFEINQGDAVGIIGRNGAGKSTLLKILSRVTAPTTGDIKVKGRIASLLEVGTGFHPELTGRENIFLNGAILGMRKFEIKQKFDEIVEFSGVERFIDTPVKRYSSGMYVRLAFAVAAHLESEILIVDEVLAVGDAEFQKKCLGKMGEVSKAQGRTVLFVSHNMGSIISLCKKGIVVDKGNVSCVEKASKAIEHYLEICQTPSNFSKQFSGTLKGKIKFTEILVNHRSAGENLLLMTDQIHLVVKGIAKQDFNKLVVIISIFLNGIRLFTIRDSENGRMTTRGQFTVEFMMKPLILRPGTYTVAAGAWGELGEWIWGMDLISFTIVETWDKHIKQEDEGIFNGNYLKVENVTV